MEIHREGCNVIRRFSPFAPRTIEQREVLVFSKEDVPRMKVAVDLAQAVNTVFQTPPPIDTLMLDLCEQSAVDYFFL